MTYAVVKIINGNFAIHTEGFTDLNKAKVSFYGFLSALYNDLDNVQSFSVMLMNDGGGIIKQENYVAPYVPEVIEDMPVEVAESEE